MPKLTETQKTILMLAAGGLLAAGAGVWIYLDYGTMAELDTKITAKKDEFEKNKQEIAAKGKLEEQVWAYRQIVEENTKILPQAAEVHEFNRVLARLEKDSNVTLEALPPPTVALGTTAIAPIPMHLKLKASTRAFLRFLHGLESHPRLVRVSNFSITSANKAPVAGQEAVHEVSLDFETYQYNPASGLVKVAIPAASVKEMQGGDPGRAGRVKDTVAKAGRPAIEQYKLLTGKEGRRDMFLDPRRAAGPVTPVDGQQPDIGTREADELSLLVTELDSVQNCFDIVKAADAAKEYLRRATAIRNLDRARQEYTSEVRKVTARTPAFTNRDIEQRFQDEVQNRYDRLTVEIERYLGPANPDMGITQVRLADARQFVKEIEDLAAARQWDAATEKFVQLDTYLKDPRTKVMADAEQEVAKLRDVGERVMLQSAFMKKDLRLQGVVRLERGSAIILNGKTLKAGKGALDEETTFLRVAEDGRLIFSYKGREVDYVPPKEKDQKISAKDLNED